MTMDESLYVAWTVPRARGGSVTIFLEMYQEANANSVSWEVRREIVFTPAGKIASHYPTEATSEPVAAVRPDPVEAIKSGEMIPITPEDFEAAWAQSLLGGGHSLR